MSTQLAYAPGAKDALVIYHGDNCHDGFGAAWVAHRHFGDRASYHPAIYGASLDSWPDFVGKHVVVLDYSMPVEMLEGIRAKAASFIQLDHHASAMEKYHKHGELGASDCIFDMDHSGAMLAWNHFNPGTPAPAFLSHVQDYDLWRFEDEKSLPFSLGARTRPMDFPTWDSFLDDEHYEAVVRDGRFIDAQWNMWLDQLSKRSVPAMLGGHPVSAVCAGSSFRSALGNKLAKRDLVFALTFRGCGDGTISASLRSLPDIMPPCKTLAESFGGGGHPCAAGLELGSLKELCSALGWPYGEVDQYHYCKEPSEQAKTTNALEEVEAWATSCDAGILRVDGRPMSPWKALTLETERQAIAELLEAQRQHVLTTAIHDAFIEPIPGTNGLTRATILLDGIMDDKIIATLLDKHAAVMGVHVTCHGVARYVSVTSAKTSWDPRDLGQRLPRRTPTSGQ